MTTRADHNSPVGKIWPTPLPPFLRGRGSTPSTQFPQAFVSHFQQPVSFFPVKQTHLKHAFPTYTLESLTMPMDDNRPPSADTKGHEPEDGAQGSPAAGSATRGTRAAAATWLSGEANDANPHRGSTTQTDGDPPPSATSIGSERRRHRAMT